MCIIIDTNNFASVFDPTCSKHGEFKPVYDWLFFGEGRIVFGGKTYRDELRKAPRYWGIFRELGKTRKTVEIDDKEVDRKQQELGIIKHPDFNDAHIIAIVIVSGCRLVCSSDSRAYPFIKNKALYPKHFKRPKIYRGCSNANLLSSSSILNICKLCKDIRESMEIH